MTIETTLAEMRATADLDSRAGAPVGAALRRAVAAVEAALGHNANMHGENYHYAHGYADAVANIRYAIADALGGGHKT